MRNDKKNEVILAYGNETIYGSFRMQTRRPPHRAT